VLNTVQAGNIAIKDGVPGAGTGYFNISGGAFNAGNMANGLVTRSSART